MKFVKKAIIVFLMLAILGIVFVSQFFLKVKVSCKSQFGECPALIYADLQKENNKTLFQAKGDINKNLKKNLLLDDFTMQFKLPNTLAVSILVRKPAFAIADSKNSIIWLVDSDGTVLTSTQGTTLPKVITENQIPKPGEKVDGETLTALKIIQGVWQMYQINSGQIRGNTLVVDLPSNINVIFPLDGDPEISLGALRLIYTKITTGNDVGKYSQIDLRFKNPVLR